jgi:hypothetical protein
VEKKNLIFINVHTPYEGNRKTDSFTTTRSWPKVPLCGKLLDLPWPRVRSCRIKASNCRFHGEAIGPRLIALGVIDEAKFKP